MREANYLIAICSILLLSIVGLAQTGATASVANPTLRKELLERGEQDQKIRNEWIRTGVTNADEKVLTRMVAIDKENTARMKEIVRQYGLPVPELVGEDGANAAFLIIQHSDHSFRKEMLPLVERAYRAGKLPGQFYALLLDRVLVGDGKPQVYGTEAKSFEQWKGKEPVLQPIADEAGVDQRRAAVGLPPLSEYLKLLKEAYFPENK